MKPNLAKAAILCCVVLATTVQAFGEPRAEVEWRWYTNPQWGYQIQYPANVFTRRDASDSQADLALQSADGRARLIFFAGPNRFELDTKGVAKTLSKADVGVITYKRVDATWVVLSGYLEQPPGKSPHTIFYERVNVSRDRRAMAGFRLEYPVEMRFNIDHLIGRLGRSLTIPSGASGMQIWKSRERPPAGSSSAVSNSVISPATNLLSDHVARCRTKYRSYDDQTDTYQRFDGIRVPCDS